MSMPFLTIKGTQLHFLDFLLGVLLLFSLLKTQSSFLKYNTRAEFWINDHKAVFWDRVSMRITWCFSKSMNFCAFIFFNCFRWVMKNNLSFHIFLVNQRGRQHSQENPLLWVIFSECNCNDFLRGLASVNRLQQARQLCASVAPEIWH